MEKKINKGLKVSKWLFIAVAVLTLISTIRVLINGEVFSAFITGKITVSKVVKDEEPANEDIEEQL